MKDTDTSVELALIKKLPCLRDVAAHLESYELVGYAGNKLLNGSHAIVRHSCGRYYVYNRASQSVVQDSDGGRVQFADAHSARAAAVEYSLKKG
jgi:hypothetical protein